MVLENPESASFNAQSLSVWHTVKEENCGTAPLLS